MNAGLRSTVGLTVWAAVITGQLLGDAVGVGSRWGVAVSAVCLVVWLGCTVEDDDRPPSGFWPLSLFAAAAFSLLGVWALLGAASLTLSGAAALSFDRTVDRSVERQGRADAESMRRWRTH